MTLERLQQYGIIVEQIELIKREFVPSYISAVDTTKPSIQSNSRSDVTADTALQQANIDPVIKAEYKRLTEELKELNDFIFGIDDELIKAIVMRRFIIKEQWTEIGRAMNYSGKYCSEIMNEYFKKHLQ